MSNQRIDYDVSIRHIVMAAAIITLIAAVVFRQWWALLFSLILLPLSIRLRRL